MNHLTSFRSMMLRAMLAAFSLFSIVSTAAAQPGITPTLPPGAEHLQVDAGHKPSYRVYAQGVQVYRFDPVTLKWTFSHPYALLYSDAGFTTLVGIHTGGPTWMTFSGSTVVGTKLQEAVVDPTAIPWLLLGAVSAEGPGVLARTTFIQRVNTVGGRAPALPGIPGQIALIPYVAEYVFYRAR
ncbi:MAG TPA: DUF3455 domain-containing protein [Planctomycetota bacterium]